MTFELKLEPESPLLPLFGRVGAYFCLTSEFSWKRLLMQNVNANARRTVEMIWRPGFALRENEL